jgi:glycosyltransferase involved in cell wall biosynthesis
VTAPPTAPLVSVIIPCYAQGHFLLDAITSVMDQTYRPVEILVVDDGSPDRDIIDAVLAPFGNAVRCVHQPNTGLSGARNAGLRLAQGEFVVCLDADDRLLPRALEAGVRAFQQHPGCGLVWGLNRLIDARGNPLVTGERTFVTEGGYAALLETNIIGPPVSVMFRREALLAAGSFSAGMRHAEDYDLYLRLVREHGMYCHGELVAEYRLHGANMSSDHRGMLLGVLQALDAQETWVRGNPALRRAWRRGRRDAWRRYDGEPRLMRLGGQLRAGQRFRALANAATLLIRYPGLLLPVVARRIGRMARQSTS